jgi:hypothetical protein
MIFKPFILFCKIIAEPNPNYRSRYSHNKTNNDTEINPVTGLPMIGNLDSLGNSFGTSASDRHSNWHSDYHRPIQTYTSSYDPFSNRYL